MVPIETLVSMLEEPSSGSIAMASGASGFSVTASSCSSEPKKAIGEASAASRKTLSATTSSSFWTSPPAFVAPWALPMPSPPAMILLRSLIEAPHRLRMVSATCRFSGSLPHSELKCASRDDAMLSSMELRGSAPRSPCVEDDGRAGWISKIYYLYASRKTK